MEWTRDEYLISTEASRLDIDLIENFLRTSYWAADRNREDIERSIENSICFGLYRESRQIGFARIVTDEVKHSWLGDVFVIQEFQGKGLGTWLMESVVSHPVIQKTGCILGTRDAHGLYEKFAFERTELMARPKGRTE